MTKPSCKKHTHIIALRTKNKQTLAHNRIKVLSRLRPPEPLRSVTLEVNLEKVWSPLETPPAKRRRRGWSGSAQISNSSEQEVWTRLAGSDRIGSWRLIRKRNSALVKKRAQIPLSEFCPTAGERATFHSGAGMHDGTSSC